MDHAFWVQAWQEGRTGFHQADFHPKLLQYFTGLSAQRGQRILVPLCGKTRDMLWLTQQGLAVRGIELYAPPLLEFFTENKLPPPVKRQQGPYQEFVLGDLTLSCGDFFQLNEENVYDLVYDRAALVALPTAMRPDYARVGLRALKPGGKILLVTYEYDQAEMEGPPFSVPETEVQSLYGPTCDVRLLERSKASAETGRLTALTSLRQCIYVIEKRR